MLVYKIFFHNFVQVARVFYARLPSHSQHELAKRMMKQFSGMVCFKLKRGKKNGIHLVEVRWRECESKTEGGKEEGRRKRRVAEKERG